MHDINGFNAQSINVLFAKLKQSFSNNQVIYLLGVTVLIAASLSFFLFKNNNYVAIDLNDNNFSSFKTPSSFTNWLKKNNYKYQTNSENNLIYVDSQDYVKIFKKINQNNLPNNQKVEGFELLDKARSFGSSQFMEAIRYKRALEGELARTISGMANIKSARVHLAIPKKTAFIRDINQSSASVFIQTDNNSESFDNDIVDSIINLVATSITGMKPSNVTVVDQSGNLLSDSVSNTNLSLPIKQEREKHKQQRKIEKEYTAEISKLLNPLVGANNYKITIDVNTKFINNPNIKNNNEELIKTKYGYLKIINITTMVLVEPELINKTNSVNISRPYSKQDLLKITNLIKKIVPYNQIRGDLVLVDNSVFNNTLYSNKKINNLNNLDYLINFAKKNYFYLFTLFLSIVFIYLFFLYNKHKVTHKKTNLNTKTQHMNLLVELTDEHIYNLIKNSHLHIQVVILSILSNDRAANIFSKFSIECKIAIIKKFIILNTINKNLLNKILFTIKNKLYIKIPENIEINKIINGKAQLSNILFFVFLEDRSLFNSIKNIDINLAEKIDKNLFMFEDLINLNNEDLKLLLNQISIDTLFLSLKGCEPSILSKFINNLDANNAEVLKEKLNSYNPVKIIDVERAQHEILQIFAKLIANNQLKLPAISKVD